MTPAASLPQRQRQSDGSTRLTASRFIDWNGERELTSGRVVYVGRSVTRERIREQRATVPSHSLDSVWAALTWNARPRDERERRLEDELPAPPGPRRAGTVAERHHPLGVPVVTSGVGFDARQSIAPT